MALEPSKAWSFVLAAAVLTAAASGPVQRVMEHRDARAATELEQTVLDQDIAFLEGRIAADPGNYLLTGHLADLYARRFQSEANLDDLSRAETLARKVGTYHPDPARTRARVSRILLTQHRFRDAFAEAEAGVAGGADNVATLEAFVAAAEGVGAYHAADSVAALLPAGSVIWRVRLATRLSEDGHEREAVRALRKTCGRLEHLGVSRDVQAWCLTRIATLVESSSVQEARAWLDRALDVRPGYRGAIEQLAELEVEAGRYARAHDLFARIAVPAHPDLYLRLAEVSRALGQEDAALQHERTFTRLASAPEMAALSGLELAGYLADRGGDCRRAVDLVSAELERRRSVEALTGSADVLEQCGDAQVARSLRDEATLARGA